MDEEMKAAFAELKTDLSTRFEQIDARFAKIEARLDRVEGRLDQIEGRLDRVERRLDQIDVRLDQIDARFARIDGRFEEVDSRFEQMRRDNVAMHEETRRHFDVVIERVIHNIALIAEGFQMNADRIREVGERCDANTAALDARVTRLEANTSRR